MYPSVIMLILSILLASFPSSSRASGCQYITVGIMKKSESVRSLDHLKSRAARFKMLSGSCSSVSLKDFQDMYYYGTIVVGDGPARIEVVFDTGSADLWVASSGLCIKPSTYCDSHGVYDHSSSTSYVQIGTPFTITYHKGYVSGIVSQDSVKVGTLTLSSQLFGEASDMDSDTASAQFEGVFGLAYPSVAVIDGHTPLVNLYRQGLLGEPIFAFSLNNKHDNKNGALTLGGLDPSHYSGNITYTPVIEQAYWKIQIGGIYVGSQTIVPPSAAVPDSGSSLIGGPKDHIDALNEALGATDYGSGINVISCSKVPKLPNISIVIEGNPFTLGPTDYILYVHDDRGNTVCVSGFMGSTDLPFFILGDVFMRRYYTVFDMGQNRVGFANNLRYHVLPTVSPSSSAGKPLENTFFLVLLAVLIKCFAYNKI